MTNTAKARRIYKIARAHKKSADYDLRCAQHGANYITFETALTNATRADEGVSIAKARLPRARRREAITSRY